MTNAAQHRALGVCYYPEHWPVSQWSTDAKRMSELGLRYVRIGEFSWSTLEPVDGQLNFDWLDEAIHTLGSAGLQVILGTPTATPPKWLVDKMPDMLACDTQGLPRGFGSRRHYCFSHLGYRKACVRIVRIMAERYATNPHIVAWQTDNEYGCHDTTVSYSNAAKLAFHVWLRERYHSIDALNSAWGNVFWSMQYASFDEIELPNLTVTEANPAHRMAFRRFSSDQVVVFNRLQTNILRKYCPTHDLVHNYMGNYVGFNHYSVAEDLDVATWDSYPLGFLQVLPHDEEHKQRYARAGDPDFQAFHHDLYRGVGRGRWWVMEQQPGPVNWAPYNPAPNDGQVRLWTLEAFAHGAELVSYFRWRQAPFAQEQMHTALRRADDEPDVAYAEVQQVADELRALEQTMVSASIHRNVALVFDYETAWAISIQPQGADFDYFTLVFQWYRALRLLGLSIDIVPPTEDLSDYQLIVLPSVIALDDQLIQSLTLTKATVLIGPRSGSRTDEFKIPDSLPPGKLQSRLPIAITRVESLRNGLTVPVGEIGKLERWREFINTDAQVLLHSDDGWPVLVQHNNLHYLAGWPDASLLNHVMQGLCASTPIDCIALEQHCPDVRIRDYGLLRFFFNYGQSECSIASLLENEQADFTFVSGSDKLAVAGVSVVQLKT